MNPLEMQLRSWVPRRPSARLKKRLFPAPASPSAPAGSFSWLAPATACLLVAVVVLGQRDWSSNSPGASHRSALVATVLSNQSSAAYLSGGFWRSRNQLASFAWTNGSRSNKGDDFLLPLKTDD
jgi:hypothetical protein